MNRTLVYLGAGFPVHLTGPAGTGKTCLALYVAAQIGRPVVIIHGDEELGTTDIVGGNYGFRHRKVVDNFVHSVKKLGSHGRVNLGGQPADGGVQVRIHAGV